MDNLGARTHRGALAADNESLAAGAMAGEPGRQRHWPRGECLFCHYVFRKRTGRGPLAVRASSGLRNGDQARRSSNPAKSIPGIREQ
jgi:hypothetical protein